MHDAQAEACALGVDALEAIAHRHRVLVVRQRSDGITEDQLDVTGMERHPRRLGSIGTAGEQRGCARQQSARDHWVTKTAMAGAEHEVDPCGDPVVAAPELAENRERAVQIGKGRGRLSTRERCGPAVEATDGELDRAA